MIDSAWRVTQGDCQWQTPSPTALPRDSEIASRPRQAKGCDHFSVPPQFGFVVAEAMADMARERFSVPAWGVLDLWAGWELLRPVSEFNPGGFQHRACLSCSRRSVGLRCSPKWQTKAEGGENMAVQITEATIHHLEKVVQTRGVGCVTVHPRIEQLPVDAVLLRLCESLILMYTKAANTNGTLGIDPRAHKFPVHLQGYLEGRTAFMPFTREAVGLIAQQMQDSFLASGGYALFLRYQIQSHDFVLIAMLKLKPGAGIDAGTLSLTETLNIDLAHLNEAARINLTRWREDQQPYLTFIKGATRQAEVSEYFRQALACTSFTDSKHHTEAVLRAAHDFFDARTDLSVEQRREEKGSMRRRLFECLDSNREEVPLATIAAAVNPLAPEAFLEHVRNRPEGDSYNLDERFKPNRATYIGLKRLRGKMGSVSLSFDVADVQSERVRYDAITDTIILQSPTAPLKTSILEHAPAPDQQS